jgi:hypothetical protein
MTPIYDALRATALGSTPAHATDAVSSPPAEGRPDLRLVPPTPPAPTATLRPPAPAVPIPFPVRVLSTRRTPPWRAGLLP